MLPRDPPTRVKRPNKRDGWLCYEERQAGGWPVYEWFLSYHSPWVGDGHDVSRADVSRADSAFAEVALDDEWEKSMEEVVSRLMEKSPKARKDGLRYAELTTINAAAKIAARHASEDLEYMVMTVWIIQGVEREIHRIVRTLDEIGRNADQMLERIGGGGDNLFPDPELHKALVLVVLQKLRAALLKYMKTLQDEQDHLAVVKANIDKIPAIVNTGKILTRIINRWINRAKKSINMVKERLPPE